MKNPNKFLLTLALFAASMSVAYAETPAQLKTTIETFAHGGTGTLTATVSGNTVTVTGNVTGVKNSLYLDFDAGVTVLWQASYEGYGRVYFFSFLPLL